jgi:hypothetical protein
MAGGIRRDSMPQAGTCHRRYDEGSNRSTVGGCSHVCRVLSAARAPPLMRSLGVAAVLAILATPAALAQSCVA